MTGKQVTMTALVMPAAVKTQLAAILLMMALVAANLPLKKNSKAH
jgi:hypothetical protein